jgi:ATP synthase F1 delta subunit
VSSVNLVSKRYAKALFLAAVKFKSLDQVSASLSNLSRVFEDMPSEVQRVFLDPTVSKKDLSICVSSFLKGLPTIFNNFCNDINNHFQKLLMNSKGQAVADIWVAYSLSKNFYSDVEKVLSNTFNKKVSLNIHNDPLILGGIVIELDGFRLDASILGNLNQLSCHMKGAR